MATMTRNYSKSELDALRKKLRDSNKTVMCPRCGNEIVYKEIGNSISVSCKRNGCIAGGIRGI
ncbi:hypothetical protein FACS1894133_5340 [Clostridia bacterium]|nr:hypothetical protein FACS1894133_5340 [Clostridia bacterium]